MEVVVWDICLRIWMKWTYRLKEEILQEKKKRADALEEEVKRLRKLLEIQGQK